MPHDALKVDRGAGLAGAQPLRLRQRGRVRRSPGVHLRDNHFDLDLDFPNFDNSVSSLCV